MKIVQLLKRKNLALLVPVLTILAMGLLVSCANKDDGEGSSPVAVTGVTLDKTTATINGTNSITLIATVAPSNASNKKVTWKSSDESVATVDTNGKVTGVDGGTATITVTTADGGFTATADITVKVPVTGVSISPNSNNAANPIMAAQGASTYLTAVIVPSNATNQEVTWEVVDPSSASGITVDANGKVSVASTVTLGKTATIKVNTKDGSYTAQAYITVVIFSPEAMITVPTNGSSTITFPYGYNGYITEKINHKFAMSQTEVTYELWKKVYDWASTTEGTCVSATGQYCYTFANEGWQGAIGRSRFARAANTGGSVKQPVTKVSLRDAIVWSNAYTEWYNAKKGGSLTVVYYTDAAYTTPLRISTNTRPPSDLDNAIAGSEDKPYIKASSDGNTDAANNIATGFRLPTTQEWEYAARLRKDATNAVADGKPSGVNYPISIGGTDYWFTKGDSASGAKANYKNATETGKVAWYGDNSCDDGTGCKDNVSVTSPLVNKTRVVGTKKANALGLYDMSGNVAELCYSEERGWIRGGEFYSKALFIQVSENSVMTPNFAWQGYGFRVAQTVP